MRRSCAQLAKAISDCTKIVSEMKAKRVVAAAKKRQNSVNDLELDPVLKLPPGAKVLVYRQNEGWVRWEVPMMLIRTSERNSTTDRNSDSDGSIEHGRASRTRSRTRQLSLLLTSMSREWPN